jgi:hypothetical protein
MDKDQITESVPLDSLPPSIRAILWETATKHQEGIDNPSVCAYCGQNRVKKGRGRPLGAVGVKKRLNCAD